MATEKSNSIKKIFKNRFILGLITGFVISKVVSSLFLGIVLLVVLSLAWYGASRRKNKTDDEPVDIE